MLTRFGWLGDADEVLQRAGVTRAGLRALEGDDEIYAALETRRDAACNTPWRFEHPQAREAEFFTAAFAPVLPDLLRHAWGAVPYGFSVLEAVYRPAGDPASPTPGYIGLAQVVGVPFDWCRILPTGELEWAESQQPLDPRKFFACVRESSLRRPMGEALLSRLYWPWFFRTNGWKFWMKFMERAAVPFLLGKTSGDKTDALNALSAAVQDAVMVSGIEDDVRAIDMGAGKVDFNQFETAVVRRFQRLILGQTLTSGTDGGSGNRALGEVHNEVRGEKKQADARLLVALVQRMADMLAALNGIAPPVFVMEDGSGLEMARAQRDKTLTDAGIVRFTEEYVRETYGLAPEHFTVPEASPARLPASAAPVAPQLRAQGLARLADGDKPARQQFTAGQQALEDQIDASLGALPSPLDPKAIAGAIRAARDPDDLVERLGLLLRDADRAEFNRVLERALFAADVMGYAHATAGV
jgi:phage gp29-like protein